MSHCTIAPGHAPITGLSFIVTVNVHDALLVQASVAVHVTVVVPAAKVEPDAGEQTTVGVPQLSVAVGLVHVGL